MTMWTYDDKVSLISSRRENFGIIVQGEELNDLMTTLFAVLWQASTPAEAGERQASLWWPQGDLAPRARRPVGEFAFRDRSRSQ